MEYTPRKKGHGADAAVIVLFAAAVILFGISNALTGIFHAVPQIAALFALTAAVYIGIRYRFTEFRYVLSEDTDGGVLLTVHRATGRRTVAEARMSGAYLEETIRFDNRTGRESLKEAKKGKSVYVYTVSLRPQSVVMCVFTGDFGKKTALILEGEGEFFDTLASIAEKNRRAADITDVDTEDTPD